MMWFLIAVFVFLVIGLLDCILGEKDAKHMEKQCKPYAPYPGMPHPDIVPGSPDDLSR